MSPTHEQINVILNTYQAVVLSVIVWLLGQGYRMLMDIHSEIKRGKREEDGHTAVAASGH